MSGCDEGASNPNPKFRSSLKLRSSPAVCHNGAVAIRQPYIKVVGSEEANEVNSRGPIAFRHEEIEEFKKFAISPSMYGHDDVKRPQPAYCLEDQESFKFVEKTAPLFVYTSEKGSSAVVLAACVIRDSCTREFYLVGGAMVLEDGGVVCIDEFKQLRPEDRVAIHEAMEQQTISIAKAEITTVLNSRSLQSSIRTL